MKPELEKVLFDDHCCNGEEQSHHMKLCKEKNCKDENCPCIKISKKAEESLFLEDLRGKYYAGFIKYFKVNSKDSISQASKNTQKSLEAKIMGNKLFAKKNHDTQVHEEIWKLYSKSIAFAPIGSKELVIGYECRSNLLLHLQKYEESIKDIDRALAITKFDMLKVKLLCRKMTCFAATNKNITEKENLWLSIKNCFEKVDGTLKDEKFLNMVKQARIDSSSPPNDSTASVKEDSEFIVSQTNVTRLYSTGISVSAKRDFVPGEVIFVTKPYIVSINPEKFYAYCSHCSALMWTGVPCDECSLCMYCSEECKAEAWEKYHVLECKILPHINFDHIAYYNFKTCLKAFFMGLREFGSIEKLLKVAQEIDDLRGSSKLGKMNQFSDSAFFKFYASPYLCKDDFCLLNKFSKHTCFLLAYITQTCDIFTKDVKSSKGTELAKNKEFVSCGLLMLKIYSLSCYHFRPLYNRQMEQFENTTSKNDEDSQTKQLYTRGSVFDFFNAMSAHYCDPNMSICYTDDGKIVYFSTQSIKKNDKLTMCVSSEFYRCKKDDRKIFNIDIDCLCYVCKKDWPIMEKMYNKYKQRSLKVESKVTAIVKKYMERNDMKVDKVDPKNCKFNKEEFQELANDVNAVLKVCGQPSFASSLMISFLCLAFVQLHGLALLESNIPQDC